MLELSSSSSHHLSAPEGALFCGRALQGTSADGRPTSSAHQERTPWRALYGSQNKARAALPAIFLSV